jgi:uncharacterized protein
MSASESPAAGKATPELQAPLNEQELDLESLLREPAFEGKAVPLDALQGLICAVLSSPQEIGPDLWLPLALGDTPRYESDAQADEIESLLLRFHAGIAADLRSEDGISLILYPLEEGGEEYDYATWCAGYLDGVDLSDPHWTEASDDEEVSELLLPFLVLAGALEDDPQLRAELDFAPGDEEAFARHWKENLADCVHDAYDYWLEHRLTPDTFRREAPKVGRNDPCPCGSGRKFKVCHGA